MDTVKEFIKEYKKHILITTVLGITYSLGFRKGFNSAKEGMNYVFDQAARSFSNITRF